MYWIIISEGCIESLDDQRADSFGPTVSISIGIKRLAVSSLGEEVTRREALKVVRATECIDTTRYCYVTLAAPY